MLKRIQLPATVPRTCQPSCPDSLNRQIAVIRDAKLGAQSHGAGRREPCGRVAEVEAAGAVEGFFGGSGWLAAGQEAVLVVVVAGAVDRESPGAGVAAVAEPAQRLLAAVGQLRGDVGELAAEAHADAGELGPPLAGGLAGAPPPGSSRVCWRAWPLA